MENLLFRAYQLAQAMPNTLNMLTTWEVNNVSLNQETRFTIGDLRDAYAQGQLTCDVVTLIAMLAAEAKTSAAPPVIQDVTMNALKINLTQYEELVFFPLWPRPYAGAYRLALQRNYELQSELTLRRNISERQNIRVLQLNCYEQQVKILHARLAHFVRMNG